LIDAVQARLAERNPKRMPARVVSSPTLLIGLARCGCKDCGGALTIRTGKSGQYRYYACSRRAARGETACAGQSIRMEKLDRSVLDALEDRIVAPGRLPDLLAAFLEKSDESDNRRREELTLLRSAKTHSTGALNRLFELVEQGLAAPSDRDFAERLTIIASGLRHSPAISLRSRSNSRPVSAGLHLTSFQSSEACCETGFAGITRPGAKLMSGF
jgi:hypothetical protein